MSAVSSKTAKVIFCAISASIATPQDAEAISMITRSRAKSIKEAEEAAKYKNILGAERKQDVIAATVLQSVKNMMETAKSNKAAEVAAEYQNILGAERKQDVIAATVLQSVKNMMETAKSNKEAETAAEYKEILQSV